MIPETITIGHILMLLGTLAGLYALAQLVTWTRHRGPSHGPGTPGYAVPAMRAATLYGALPPQRAYSSRAASRRFAGSR